MEIIDKTETNLVALRRLIYLTVQSRLIKHCSLLIYFIQCYQFLGDSQFVV